MLARKRGGEEYGNRWMLWRLESLDEGRRAQRESVEHIEASVSATTSSIVLHCFLPKRRKRRLPFRPVLLVMENG